MALRCRFLGHDAAPAPIWNAGRHFSTCKRCGADLVRSRGMIWRTAPKGMKIVWRKPTEAEADAAIDFPRTEAPPRPLETPAEAAQPQTV